MSVPGQEQTFEHSATSKTLPALDQPLTGRLLAFERLDEAWLLLLPPSCSGHSVILRM